jgi:predicted aconitase
MLEGRRGPAAAMAMRIVTEAARMLGAADLVDIASAHIDGCLYHGDSGTHFVERLTELGGHIAVPATLNVGALDLLHPNLVRLEAHRAEMARRTMSAYAALGCRQSWTCAPYQAGHRPAAGTDVAWGESNAVAFCNSVLGARTNRYGDFLDICAAMTGRAPRTGLHIAENRRAKILVDVTSLRPALLAEDAFYPVLGSWLGSFAGDRIVAIDGLERLATEDRLKSLGAAAASTGSVALFHVIGVTPEARPPLDPFAGVAPEMTIRLTGATLAQARNRLSTAQLRIGDPVDVVAIGSPHLSLDEFRRALEAFDGRRSRIPFYACTGRHVVEALEREGMLAVAEKAGITIVADTCIVVTPILVETKGVLLTNSGKFAHYAPGNTGYSVLYGSLGDCVETAVAGRLARDEQIWA